MTFYITGSTRGLGKYLCKHFDCTSVNRPTDLTVDIDKVVDLFEEGDIVILNNNYLAHGRSSFKISSNNQRSFIRVWTK